MNLNYFKAVALFNHHHVVLHVDKTRTDNWDLKEVAERWIQLYKGSRLVDRWLQDPEWMDYVTVATVEGIVEAWRERLYSISWFMRGVNETIARMANEDEGCKGTTIIKDIHKFDFHSLYP